MNDYILRNYALDFSDKWHNLGLNDSIADDQYRFKWFHMHRSNLQTQKWLYQNNFDELVVESLTDEDTRPRTTVFPDGILLNMRAVNTDKNGETHDMLSMRMFIQKDRIISTSLSNLHILDDIVEIINSSFAPLNKSEFLAYMIELITDRIEGYIAEEKDYIYKLECDVIDQSNQLKQDMISDIRRSVITFERYLSPQKDALVKMLALKESIFEKNDRIVVTESVNNTRRFLEDMASINNRCHILKDDMSARSQEKMNKNMYMLSVVAAVFLPLSFLTGLFGSNLGGIPGAENVNGFKIFSIILATILIIQLLVLRFSKRF